MVASSNNGWVPSRDGYLPPGSTWDRPFKAVILDEFGDVSGRGRAYWFCYRADKKALDAGADPLGPFFHRIEAAEAAVSAAYDDAPLKLIGVQYEAVPIPF